MSDAELKRLQDEASTIQAYLVAAQGVLDSGYMPDITSLETRVAALCARVQKAPEEIHGQCREQLVALLGQLDSCEAKMRAFHSAHNQTEDKK